MRFCELCEKGVVNTADGRCLGNITDLEFDECSGEIRAFIIPVPGKFCNCFFREFEYCIPWNRVVCIGPDVVLVNICLEDVRRHI